MASLKNKEQARRLLALLFVLFLLFLIVQGLWRYIGAFFGTGILYVLFRRMHDYFHQKTFLGRKASALLTILISLLIVIIPTFLLLGVAINQLSGALSDPQAVIDAVAEIDAQLPGWDITGMLQDQVPRVTQFLADTLLGAISDITRISISLFITYFLLFFLLVQDEKELGRKTRKLIPFNKKNSQHLLLEFKKITNATLITTGLMALLQGFMLAIILVIFGIKAAVFWGLLGAFLSFLPVVGPALIWVPIVIFEIAQGDVVAGIVITAWGFVIANIDNFLRPLLNRKVGKINQVVSLLGIFMGLAVFGLIGVVVGPIILSFFLLTIRMFKEEYLEG